MRVFPLRALLFSLLLSAAFSGGAYADDITLSGVIAFNSLDGSADDHDGAANGVFTVDDGNLVIDGTIQCNDDSPLPAGASACPIRLSVSGNLLLNPGGALIAENRRGAGSGGLISLEVGGDLVLYGPSGALPGSLISSSRTSGSTGSAGSISAVVNGGVEMEPGSIMAAGNAYGQAGAINIQAGGRMQIAGLIASGPGRTLLADRWNGVVLNGGTSAQIGGSIVLRSSAPEPGIQIKSTGTVVSQSEKFGMQLVLLEACGIEVRGLVAAVTKGDGGTRVALRSGKGILVDGQDLANSGGPGSRQGRVRSDSTKRGTAGFLVDLFAQGDIQVLGPTYGSTSLFAVSANPGNETSPARGAVTAVSLSGSIAAHGNAIEAGRWWPGDKGGIINLSAANNLDLDGAHLRAVGDYSTTSSARQGGQIKLRSYQGEVAWTFGRGDVRPTGSAVPAAKRGTITITACSGIDVTGTSFPVQGSPVAPFPAETDGVCAPTAPSLPAGEPALPVCGQPPVADSQSVTTDEDVPETITLTGSDPSGDSLTFSIVTPPAHGSLGPLTSPTATSVQVVYTPDADYNGSDSFVFQVDDGNGGTDTATVDITIEAVDDAPEAVDDTATVTEGSGPSPIDVLSNDTDVDDGPKSIGSVTQPANGTVVVAADGLSLTYQPNANYCNTPPGTNLETFTYTLSPAGANPTATVSVTVDCVDGEPTAVPDAATVSEDALATVIDVLANDTDPDGGVKTIASATDPLNGTVAVAGDGLSLSYSPDANYCNAPPGTTLDTFNYTLSPGGSSTTVMVTVTCVDDTPVAVADGTTVPEDAPATAIDVLSNDTDIDGGPKTIASAGDPAKGTVVITGGGTGLTYQPDANYCGADSFSYTLNGGSSAIVTVTVTCVNDAPVLADATIDYTVVGNTQLRVGESTDGNSLVHIRDNNDVDEKASPSDIDGPGPITVVPFSGNTGKGDLILNSDGTFTYEPNAGFEGTDVITFQVTDNGSPAAVSNGTLTITVSNTVWYVHDVVGENNPEPGDTGRSTNAFESLGDVASVLTDNDYIYVFEGNTGATPHGGIRITKTGVKLIGAGVALDVPGFDNLIGPGNQPRVVNTVDVPAQEDHGVAVDATTASLSGVEIRGLNISGRDNGIDVTAVGGNSAEVTISNNTITSDGATGLEGIDINANSTGATTVTVSNNSLSGRGNAFDARTAAAGALRIDFSNNANILSSTGSGLVIDGAGGGTTTITAFANNSVDPNTFGTGMSVTNATFDQTPGGAFQQVAGGATVVGASGNGVGGSGVVLTNSQGILSFSDLDIFADGGAGLRASSPVAYTGSAGLQLAIQNPNVAIIEAVGGPAIDMATATINLPLSSLKSTNSPTTGLALNSVAGTFSAGASSSISNIASAAGTAFQVGSSNASITYEGTINTTQGRGVALTSNTGSTIGFTGALVLNSGASPTFTATGGGTVTATSTSSTLTATTGTPLTVTGTTIGSAGLKFQSVSANGAPNGIVLNGTGAGAVTVAGTGTTDGSGGTIQNTTSDAVILVNNQGTTLRNMNLGDATATPSQTPNATNNIGGDGLDLSNADGLTLNNVKVSRTAGHGIDGTGVTNLTIVDSEILNAGDGNTEHGLAFDDVNQNNLDGTVQIMNTVIDAFAEDGLRLENFSGTLNLTLNTVTIGRNANTLCGGVTCGENGAQVRADGTASITYTVTNSFFDDVDGNGIFVVAEGPGGVANVNINTTRVENATALGIVLFGGDVVGNPSQLTFSITNNNSGDDGIFNSKSHALSIQPNGSATVRGTVSGTRIQGSQLGYGIDVPNDDDSKGVLTFSGNVISGTECNGIRVLNGNTAELDVHIRSNNVSTPTDASGNGICHGIEVNVRETSDTCLDIAGNTSDGAGGAVGFRTRQRDTSIFQMERYTGGATNTTDVVNFLVSQNTSGDASATVATGYVGVADGACEEP